MKRIVILIFIFSFLISHFTTAQVANYVDPRIGSEGLGRTFIGPCVPFGMIKPGPDCGTSNNAGWAPMPSLVSGFSQTHVSGTGGGPKYGKPPPIKRLAFGQKFLLHVSIRAIASPFLIALLLLSVSTLLTSLVATPCPKHEKHNNSRRPKFIA